MGAIANDQAGSPLFGSTRPFHGYTPGPHDLLIATTYYGDANLDGKVDGSDYSLIDSGYLLQSSGWFNGDFNYDGQIDGSDYTLIDNAFNTQGTQLPAELANISSEVLVSAVVPEPAMAGVLTVGMLASLGRRGRRFGLGATFV